MNKTFFLLPILLLFCSFQAFSQIKLSGVIFDENETPFPGVRVIVANTSRGTISDINGKFEIENLSSQDWLEFSMIGYKKQKVNVGKNKSLQIILEPDEQILDEVVAIGYSTIKKEDISGAVSVVNVKDALNGVKNGVADALQGRVAGVSVKKSAAPGDQGQIYLRGIGSFYTSSTPLFVIDGIPTDDSRSFNANDIESIQVLKDAAAASIYGSRAFNGVIIVTTKKGAKDQKKVDFSYRTGFQFVQKPFDLMGSDEWMAMNTLRYKNVYGEKYYERYMPVITDKTINTDWYDQVFQVGKQDEYDLSFSNASKDASYRASINYYKQKGIVKANDFERFTARINTSWKRDWLRFEESLMFSTSQQKTQGGSAWSEAIGMPSVIPVYDKDGNFSLGSENSNKEITRNTNPIAQREKTLDSAENYHVMGSMTGEISFTKWLKYRLVLGMDINANFNNTKTKDIKVSLQDEGRSSLTDTRSIGKNFLIENLLEFNNSFDKHNINAIAGYTEQYFNNDSETIKVMDILHDQNNKYYFTLNNGQDVSYVSQSIGTNTLRSYLGRVIYNYDQKYYFTGSVRADGSSRFGKDVRYGYFPSSSLAWRISKEKFFENVPLISDLKLRASYGVLGNQEIGNWQYTPYLQTNLIYMFGPGQTIDYSGKFDHTIVDENIKWEEKVSSNIGFELYLLNNKLGVTLDYYYDENRDLLAYVDVPYYTGHTPANFWDSQAILTNAGTVSNSGLELSINYRDMLPSSIAYDLTLNLSTTKNKVKKVGGSIPYIPWDAGFAVLTRTTEGRSIGEFFLLQGNGIYQEGDPDLETLTIRGKKAKPGDYKYIDHDGNNDIDDNDRVYCGSPWPKFEFSLQANLAYKAFDFSMFWYGNTGRKVYNSLEYNLTNTGGNGNYRKGLLAESWTPENMGAKYSSPQYGGLIIQYSDNYLQDGSFLRLGNVQVGYDLTSLSIVKKAKIDKLRVYVSGENLLTLSKYDGWNVDFKGNLPFGYGYDGNTYPTAANIQAGIQFSF